MPPIELADSINRALLGLHIDGAAIDFGTLPSGHMQARKLHGLKPNFFLE